MKPGGISHPALELLKEMVSPMRGSADRSMEPETLPNDPASRVDDRGVDDDLHRDARAAQKNALMKNWMMFASSL